MIKLNSGKKKFYLPRLWGKNKYAISYSLPTSWSEVTYSQWKRLQSTDDDLEIISILSGIDRNIIMNINPRDIEKLGVVLSFINTKLNIEDYEPPSEIVNSFGQKAPLVEDITEKTYGQKVHFHELMKDNIDDIIPCLSEIVAIYSQPFIDRSEFDVNRIEKIKSTFEDVFLVDLYSTARYYLDQLSVIVKKEMEYLSSEPNSEQAAAGVKMFVEFGVMNTIKALAGGDILKYEEVLKIEYGLVYLHLRMSKAQADFSENYRKVIEQKNKRK